MITEHVLDVARVHAVQLALVIAAVGAATFLFCRRRPHVAYALWMVALLKCFVPPVWGSPTSVFSWLEARTHPAAVVQPVGDARVAATPAPPLDQSGSPASVPVSHLPSGSTSSPLPPAVTFLRPAAWLPAAWAAGAVVMLAVPLWRSTALRRRVERESVAPPADVASLTNEMAAALGVAHRVRIVLTELPVGPALFGVVRPLLVLPRAALGHPREHVRQIIAHELVHVRRRDPVVAAAQWVAGAVWWFHPLVWWMNREIGRARELSCDEETIAALRCEPAGYAQMLIDVLRSRRAAAARPAAFALGVTPPHVTSDRLGHIMCGGDATAFRRRTPRWCWAAMVVVALLAVPGAGLVREAEVNAQQPNDAGAAAQQPPTAAAAGETLRYGGTVVDKVTKQPIPGVTVTVHRKTTTPPGMRKFAEPTKHTTDDRGRFTFEIPPEQAAEAALYLEFDVAHPAYAGSHGFGYALSMIRKNQSLGAEPFFTNIELHPAEAVTAVIHDPAGNPLGGARVKYITIAKTEHPYMAIGPELVSGDVTTDAAGRFGFPAIKGGEMAGFWVEHSDYAVLHVPVRAKRGDLGAFRVEPGVRLTGRVLDAQGVPMPRLQVHAESEKTGTYLWRESERRAWTDDDGRFALDPLKAGAYTLKVSTRQPEDLGSGRLPTRRLTAAFAPQPVTIVPPQQGGPTQAVEIRAIPHVTVRLQFVDAAGNPTGGHDQTLAGQHDGKPFVLNERIDEAKRVEFTVPRGAADVKLLLMTNEHSAIRRRRGDGPVENHHNGEWNLGTLNADVTDLFVIRYKAPIVVARVIGPGGRPSDARPEIFYPPGTLQRVSGEWMKGSKSDVLLVQEGTDGSWRSVQLLPDQEFRLSVEAPGAEPWSQTMTLKEGEVREIEIRLKPGPATLPATQPAP